MTVTVNSTSAGTEGTKNLPKRHKNPLELNPTVACSLQTTEQPSLPQEQLFLLKMLINWLILQVHKL